MIELSVIIPTYNPDQNRLDKTLEGLKNQLLPYTNWELLIIDNNASNNFTQAVDLSWHPNARIIKEPQQGLTFARVNGFTNAKGDLVIMADDDNILEPGYLQQALEILKQYPSMGAAGGRSLPIFEYNEPKWLGQFYGCLALRDLGDKDVIETWQNKFPAYAPIGAGMVIRKEALKTYLAKISSGMNIISDRTGRSLSSGGDNDIVLEILKSGWQTGYFPTLVLHHIIPKERLTIEYLARLSNNCNCSWIRLLHSHGINPWKKIPAWSVRLRKIKAWFTYKAWKNGTNYINWQGACGTFDGLSNIK